MYLDASAIVAILGRESDVESLITRLEAAATPLVVSPPGLFEAVLGLAAKKARAAGREPDAEMITRAEASVRQFVVDLGAEEISVTPEIGRAAIEVAKRYSRAVGSPAALNFGDCFAYACARSRDLPLLYKGNDFAQTDLA
ncbi:hypothetical protein ASE66_00995 [Bosea sp. Root483D1]|uniref:type II toxin-antitoxin system VapC family toxin n=1 Tax=Bosea sp. Root483D1 TaxID=1736544 RepID=UPI00070EEF5C|nr:type II toxin-antitoxin system VapC family toxin [Bosea sp. Root483D1]KRE23880.1 hypothetical protein ASE66_00995 [Bosea sp. Root483D1]